ncbi:hypothetical protein L3N51_02352 [Metallosphaera sp. J1]|uniref:hydantoinase B/oxoprolinase family protein n=1 Tax=Metallosphaera javensis (ex Hofmann et al. 2022) TaxID=99938 RepID=UPI001EDDEB91|nr:hydantoinase B/oxoprolinase family protein [Metallosphaera javensis (ex Hofmann et al. 2022)]MCG3110055.1 hypothetical protein [Metallosphaera javensis (ex Hofmann et al. 2022)]
MTSWEIVSRAFEFVAEEMGVMLKRSAMSPNIRERMDHSCAIVNERGDVVAQAEHIPVHLGSFSIGVKNLLQQVELEDGDMAIVNDPYVSGTHLNDVMVIAPVFRGKLLGYVVNKAHHVDVGGPIPGSLNPYASTLYEEGFVIPPLKLMRNGKLNDDVVRIIRENFKVSDTSLGDLNAQISANLIGIARVKQLVEKYGVTQVVEAWNSSMEYARRLTLTEVARWPKGAGEEEDYLELDRLTRIRVRVEVSDQGVLADFSGTDPQVESPFNAVYGVTFSAVSFVIRSLLRKDVPTNEGFYSVVKVRAPVGSLVNPTKPSAVGGGNVETSQRIADVTFKALSHVMPVPAAGAGTMMNIMMGGLRGRYWAYYETVGGGTGARPDRDGVSAVQVNMTNTLNTPIEIAERQYPLLFTAYRVREGSGGRGRFKGGDGIIRAFKVLDRTRLSVMAERFLVPPWGLLGGGNGKPGRVTIISGKVKREMPSKFSTVLEAGDEVVIETPGGGGLGKEETAGSSS